MFPACQYPLRNRCAGATNRREECRRGSCVNSSPVLCDRPLRITKSRSPSRLNHRNLVSIPIRGHYTRVSKTREARNDQSTRTRSRSPHDSERDYKYQSDTSSVISFIDTPSSSCQSHASADIEPRTNECLPLSDQTEPTPEAKSPEALEDENRPGEPSTEHQANLEAASEHTQPLYLEYYERAYGKDYVEEEDIAYTYWKWDKQKEQWHHRNEDTKSEAWFRA